MVKRIVTIAVAGIAALTLGVSGARAGTTVAFLCYSKFQVDPGVWPLAKDGVHVHDTAADLMALGYWSPFAETVIPTNTKIGGDYLICNLPSTLSMVTGKTFSQKGDVIATNPWFLDHPGYYPLATS